MNSVAHIEVNVLDIVKSVKFYSSFLGQLHWKKFDLRDSNVVGFGAPDGTHLFLVQTEQRFISNTYHRKNVGLNHIAFRVESMEVVDAFNKFLQDNRIPVLYSDGPKDYSSEYSREHYYAVFFEDPDRIKLEVVYYK